MQFNSGGVRVLHTLSGHQKRLSMLVIIAGAPAMERVVIAVGVEQAMHVADGMLNLILKSVTM